MYQNDIHKIISDILKPAIDNASKYLGSFDIAKIIKEQFEPLIKNALSRPEIKERIEKAISEGIEMAISSLPNNVKKAVVDHIVDSFKNFKA